MASLSHRGPNAENSFHRRSLYLKHFRLAIIGSHAVASQPMASLDRRVVLAFNGEIYNFKELAHLMGRSELARDGDTRVLVEFLATYGLEKLELLNGMFAFAVYFENSNSIYLVRDRFGIKPLYYLKEKGGIYFASEIKSLLSLRPFRLDHKRVINYLEFGSYPHDSETFYEDISQLTAGNWIKFSDDKYEKNRWYDLSEKIIDLREQPHSTEYYENLLEDSIALRMQSNVPMSLHYSGGTDSTALLLKLKESWCWNFPLETFTIAFNELDNDESSYAESYCEKFGVKNHRSYLCAEDVPVLARELHEFMDEPYGGVPTIAYYLMNQIEQEKGFIVSIEGQGGDETFGGYLYHVYLAAYDLYKSGSDPSLLELILKAHNLELMQVVQKAKRLINSGFKSHTDMTNLKNFNSGPVDKFVDWLLTIQLYDVLVNKIPRTLRFNDRASMATGREVRFPLLDHRLLEYGLSLRHEIKYSGGYNKAPLRKIIRRHLPGAYISPKRSVVTPQTTWLQNELKPWALDNIEVLRSSGRIHSKYFRIVNEFYENPCPPNSFPIWQLINLSFYTEVL